MNITFDNLLMVLGITEDGYILAIRSSIETPTEEAVTNYG